MHLLHLTHQYPPHHIGGVETYTQNIATHQAAQGHTVTVAYPGNEWHYSQQNNVHVYQLPSGTTPNDRTRTLLHTWWNNRLKSALTPLLQNIDIIHIQHLMGWPLTIFENIKSPTIITLHDYWFPCANAQLLRNTDNQICSGPDQDHHNCAQCALARSGLNLPISKPLAHLFADRTAHLRPILQQASAIIAPTPFVAKIYADLGFTHPNTHIIPHGIQSSTERSESLITKHYPLNTFHLAYIGGLSHQKGIHTLIDAFNQLPENYTLTIAGDTTAFPHYVAQLKAQATHPNITFLGKIPPTQVHDLLETTDLVVIPTLWYETSSLILDEAFLHRVPVIASDIGVLADKVDHKINGIRFPVGNAAALASAIQELASDSALYAHLQANIPPVRTLTQHLQDLTTLYTNTIDNLY